LGGFPPANAQLGAGRFNGSFRFRHKTISDRIKSTTAKQSPVWRSCQSRTARGCGRWKQRSSSASSQDGPIALVPCARPPSSFVRSSSPCLSGTVSLLPNFSRALPFKAP
jgi:predicted Fe-S protein YdhL (DUF1289 family)